MDKKTIIKDLNINIYDDVLKLKVQEHVDMGWGIRDYLNIRFPNFLSKIFYEANRKSLDKVMNYSVNKLYYQMLTEGDTTIEEIEKLGLDLRESSYIKVKYEDKIALIRVFISSINSFEFDISPCFKLDASSTGITISPGNMSDVIFSFSGDHMIGYTKDVFMYQFGITCLLLKNFCINTKKILIDKDIPNDFEEFNIYSMLYSDKKMLNIKNTINDTLIKEVSRNKSKRIETVLSSNGEGIKDLIEKYNIKHTIFLNSQQIMKISLELGKTPKQVRDFIEKYLEK